MFAIIDYGMGNLASVQNALKRLGYDSICTNNKETILSANKIILPGVGAFHDAMGNLTEMGLDEAIRQAVKEKIPFLGICLGLQLLFSVSEENGIYQGLDMVQGRVVRFDLPAEYKVPHMGWNQIHVKPGSILLQGIPDSTHFYFVHSYYGVPEDRNWVAASSDYGVDFCCALENGHVFATQFHPEKSGSLGLKILRNFGEL